jgi:hypothetical protein
MGAMNGVQWAAAGLVALLVAGCAMTAGGRPEPGRVGCRDERPPGSPADAGPRALFFIFCTQSP